MKRYCNQVEAYLAGEIETLPEAVRAHVEQCARCQRAWQLERAYRRVVEAVRETPVPASTLAWERVQAQLNARAAVRSRPMVWRYAPALGLTAMAFVGLSLLLLTRPLEPTPNSVAQAPEAASPKVKHLLSVDTAQTPRTRMMGLSLPPPPAKPRATDLVFQGAPQAQRTTPAPRVVRTRRVEPLPKRGGNGSARLVARLNAPDAPALTSVAVQEAESPPLSEFVAASAAGVDYLPLQYEVPTAQSSESEGSEHAMVGSF
ncbi:MAG: hypothetical protein RMK45_03895 [Armatimonadota bacterium]|nr:hypothetical protein [Armatimonadota bacterium]